MTEDLLDVELGVATNDLEGPGLAVLDDRRGARRA